MLYQKIVGPYKRDPQTNKVMPGVFASPELEALFDVPIWTFTEKVDGCLQAQTRVVLANGSSKPIREIVVGDWVLGYDVSGSRPVEVQAVSKKPKAGRWISIVSTRTSLGSGNATGMVKCTEDHLFWTPDRGYVAAGDLIPGDSLLSARSDKALTPLQEQVLVGKMLGDGSLTYHDLSQTASVAFGHVVGGLVDWTLLGLGEAAGNKGKRVSGFGSNIVTGRSKQGAGVYQTFRTWIDDSGTKIVPDSLKLSPVSLAFWYMDDGSLIHNEGQEDRALFATNGFDRNSIEVLLRELAVFNILGVAFESRGWNIRLNSDEAEKLFLLLAPYVPQDIQYKLPERYRGFQAWLPPVGRVEYHRATAEQKVLSVTREETTYARYDLQTETGNFFTTGGLVHNSNIRVLWDGYQVTFGGRTDKAQLPPALLAHLEESYGSPEFETILEQTFGEKPAVIFGEGYGPKINGGGIYREDVSFVGFDVAINGRYLAQGDARELMAESLNMPVVPRVWTVPETLSYAVATFQHAKYNSFWGDFRPEGWVGVTTPGLLDRYGSRIVVKVKDVDFPLLTKEADNA